MEIDLSSSLIMSSALDTSPSIGSLDLFTSAKVIGRECATINKDFLLCKKELGNNINIFFKIWNQYTLNDSFYIIFR